MSLAVSGSRVRAVFFDRDGTLNWPALPGDYIRTPGELQLLPGAAAAVRRVNDSKFLAVLATNQRWLSEPGADAEAYASVETELHRLLEAAGARLDASYTCPHATGSCKCRKPLPGLLLRAADELGISLADSYFIGDSLTDAEAGAAAGVTTILISAERNSTVSRHATYVVETIGEAVGVVFGGELRTGT